MGEALLIVKTKGMPSEDLMRVVIENDLKHTILPLGNIENLNPDEISKIGEQLIWLAIGL